MQVAATTFQVVDMPVRQLAYVRHVGPYMGNTTLFEKLFNQVIGWLQAKDLMRPDMESISVYHDDPETVPMEKHRISVGFTVPVGTKGEGPVEMMELPAGKYIVGSFEIDASEYGQAWEDLFLFMQNEQLMPAPEGLMYESYKNDPHQHPQGKHLVDICVKVRI
jgi:AraC family transcriptional regulator